MMSLFQDFIQILCLHKDPERVTVRRAKCHDKADKAKSSSVDSTPAFETVSLLHLPVLFSLSDGYPADSKHILGAENIVLRQSNRMKGVSVLHRAAMQSTIRGKNDFKKFSPRKFLETSNSYASCNMTTFRPLVQAIKAVYLLQMEKRKHKNLKTSRRVLSFLASWYLSI